MTTTATVAAPATGATSAPSAALPPPRQAALETAGMSPAQEARYRALTHELRCPLCQNQSIADSDAPISADLRDQVRARLLAGESDEAIRGFVTDRFGEFALYRPRFAGTTLWLWLAPGVLLLVGAVLVLARLRARDGRTGEASRQASAGPLTSPNDAGPAPAPDDDTARRLSRLLAEEGVAPAPSGSPTPPPRIPA